MKEFANARKALRRVHKQIDRWCKDPVNQEIFERTEREVREALWKENPDSIGDCIGRFGFLGNYYANWGFHGLMNGEENWSKIHQGWLYSTFETQIGTAYFELIEQSGRGGPPQDKGYDAWQSALHWAYATCCQVQLMEAYFGKLLAVLYPDDNYTPQRWRSLRTMEPFMLWLFLKQETSNDEVPLLAGADYGAYRGVIDHWNDEDALVQAIIDACDYHCKRMSDTGFFPEFARLPFSLVPVEILTINMVRAQLQMPMPVIEHPLLQSRCARIRGSPNEVNDEVLRQAQAKLLSLRSLIKNPLVKFRS